MHTKKEPSFITFTSRKGGTGKAAFTVPTAGILHNCRKYNTTVVDCNPPRRSIGLAEKKKTHLMTNLMQTDMEYAFILLFLYASYLSIEKYIHTGSILKWRGGRRPASGLPMREEPVEPPEDVSEEPVIGRSRYQPQQPPPMDEEYAKSEKRTDTAMKEKNAPIFEFPAPLGRSEDGEVPERHEIIGYVERPDPHRTRDVTFDNMDPLSRFMATDRLSEQEQSHARQILEQLEGTDMEHVLQTGILGSDGTLKRYIRLYVNSGREPPLLAGRDREGIIRDFGIRGFTPR